MKRKISIISHTGTEFPNIGVHEQLFYIIPKDWNTYTEILVTFSEIRDLDR